MGEILRDGALPEIDMLFLNNNQAGELGKQAIREAMHALQLKEDDSFFVKDMPVIAYQAAA